MRHALYEESLASSYDADEAVVNVLPMFSLPGEAQFWLSFITDSRLPSADNQYVQLLEEAQRAADDQDRTKRASSP